MDTDVEVLKPLDVFLSHSAFSGFEDEINIPTGIIAAEKGNIWVKNLLEDYNDKHFVKEDGSLDLTTNVVLITKNTKRQYPQIKLNNTKQEFDNVVFYPNDYFCPKNHETRKLKLTKNSYTIHHFDGSWLPKTFRGKLKRIIKKIIRFFIGEKNFEKLLKKKRRNITK